MRTVLFARLRDELMWWRWAIRMKRAAQWRAECTPAQRKIFDDQMRDDFIESRRGELSDYTDAIYYAQDYNVERAIAATDPQENKRPPSPDNVRSIFRNRAGRSWAGLSDINDVPGDLEWLIVDALVDFGPNGTKRGAPIIAKAVWQWMKERPNDVYKRISG